MKSFSWSGFIGIVKNNQYLKWDLKSPGQPQGCWYFLVVKWSELTLLIVENWTLTQKEAVMEKEEIKT